jgi:ATP phosphoribosyltransferase regulatory subunit
MNDKNTLLLPSGLYDLLPNEARKESVTLTRLLEGFESYGYKQVTPPLMEFEASLFSGRGESLSLQTFRVMDPLSQGMMGFRADITLQVARIARSRLAKKPKPLRLCYGGPILQTTPEALKKERQLTQAGIELIGAAGEQADAEVMIVAAKALGTIGISDISIDLNLPGLLSDLCPEARDNMALQTKLKDAIMRRDADMLASLPVAKNKLLIALIDAAGPVDKALAGLEKLGIAEAKLLKNVATRVKQHCPEVSLTIDPIEFRGFDYHQGIGFSIFSRGLRHELGRGGHYQVDGDSATGCTLYVTYLLRLLPELADKDSIMVPEDISTQQLQELHNKGFATLYALTKQHREEAKRMGCTHILEKGKIEKL